PLREESESPDTPTAEKAKRWSVKLDDVIARIDELWFVEYRFRGRAVAAGAFELKPGLFLSLESSKLHFHSGTLSVGKHALAKHFEGALKGRMAPTNLEEVSGLAIFERVSADFQARMRGGELGFANVYLQPRPDLSGGGALRADIDVGIERGSVTKDSRAKIIAPSAMLKSSERVLQGDVGGELSVWTVANRPSLALSLRSRQLKAQGEKG